MAGNEFLTLMGLKPVPETFWNLSIFHQNMIDVCEILSHGEAWDFSDAKDFRVKMCTRIIFKTFMVVHNQLDNIQYLTICMMFLFYNMIIITYENAFKCIIFQCVICN